MFNRKNNRGESFSLELFVYVLNPKHHSIPLFMNQLDMSRQVRHVSRLNSLACKTNSMFINLALSM